MSTEKENPTATNEVFNHELDALEATGVDLAECNRKYAEVRDRLEEAGEDRTSRLIEEVYKSFTRKELAFLWINEQFRAIHDNPFAQMMEALAGPKE